MLCALHRMAGLTSLSLEFRAKDPGIDIVNRFTNLRHLSIAWPYANPHSHEASESLEYVLPDLHQLVSLQLDGPSRVITSSTASCMTALEKLVLSDPDLFDFAAIQGLPALCDLTLISAGHPYLQFAAVAEALTRLTRLTLKEPIKKAKKNRHY